MKTNMKGALALITGPYVISFLSGVFGWYIDDGAFAFLGFCMLAGLIWAWVAELNR